LSTVEVATPWAARAAASARVSVAAVVHGAPRVVGAERATDDRRATAAEVVGVLEDRVDQTGGVAGALTHRPAVVAAGLQLVDFLGGVLPDIVDEDTG